MEVKPFNFFSLMDDPTAVAVGANANAEEEEEEIIPTFTAEELAQSRKEGYAEGHAAGLTEGKGINLDVMKQMTQAIALFSGQYQQLEEQYQDYLQQNSSFILRAALAISQKVTMEEEEERFVKRINAMLNHVTDIIISEPKLEIDLPHELAELLSVEIKKHLDENHFEGKVMITPKENMALSDCTIRWKNGGITRSNEAIWQEVEQLLHTQRVDFSATPAATDIADDKESNNTENTASTPVETVPHNASSDKPEASTPTPNNDLNDEARDE